MSRSEHWMRAVPLILLLAGCTLDPRGVIDRASLKVRVDELPANGAQLVLAARDSGGKQLTRRAPLSGQSALELIFEPGAIAPGIVELSGVVLDAAGAEIACGGVQGEGGQTVKLSLTAANTDLNCGACGRSCAAPNASRSCEQASATCGALRCAAGWSDENGDPADGCEKSCTSTGAESSVAVCIDGADNDCDGAPDCTDEQCGEISRACTVGLCSGDQSWTCSTNTWSACSVSPGLESTLAACTDGVDNDCDGKQDCADEGCSGIARSCAFQSCTGQQLWTCASNTWSACSATAGLEASVAVCTDGLDNDCDSKQDCADEGCGTITRACTLGACSGEQAWSCATNGWSACAVDNSLESTIALCSDGADNDCDGKTDCQDTGCQNINQACGTNLCAAGVKTWICSLKLFSTCTVYVPLPETTSLLCSDSLDNNCDGRTDCQDSSCGGTRCAAGKICCPDGGCKASCN